MTILVTGSTGFIGSKICRALVARGERVRAFHRPDSPLTGLSGLVLEHAIGDLTQPETLAPAMQGIEAVFHVAAQLGHRNPPQKMYAVTVLGTRNVLQAAMQAGVNRLVHTSSVAALGVPDKTANAKTLLMDETHTWNIPSHWYPYGYAKYLAELEVQKAVAQGLDAVIVNPSLVFGAGDLHRTSDSVIVFVTKRGIRFAPQGGMNVVHIDDVVKGHLSALERGRTGERYILGNENITYFNLLRTIAEVANQPQPRFILPDWLFHILVKPVSLVGKFIPLPINAELLHQAGQYFYYNLEKSRIALGLTDLLPAQQGIIEAYQWYRENKIV